jgi:uncharacterized protein YggT (Ycf19 family)
LDSLFRESFHKMEGYIYDIWIVYSGIFSLNGKQMDSAIRFLANSSYPVLCILHTLFLQLEMLDILEILAMIFSSYSSCQVYS